MSAVLFILLTMAIFVLPLIPAITEFYRKTDVAPLEVPVAFDSDPLRFARNFRSLVLQTANGGLNHVESLIKGGNTEKFVTVRGAAGKGQHDELQEVIVSKRHVTVAQRAWVKRDIYAQGNVRCRSDSHLRSVYGEKILALGAAATVTRWAHAPVIYAFDKNELYGRITADDFIHIRNRAVFERMHAPRIQFGDRYIDLSKVAALPKQEDARLEQCGAIVMQQSGAERTVFSGDVAIAPNSVVRGDLIVRGRLHLGSNVKILGSIKAHGSISIGSNCHVTGSAIAQDALLVGRSSVIGGPAIGERRIVLGNRCSVGHPNSPASVSSNRIDVHRGVVVYGTIWAREFGRAVGNRSRVAQKSRLA